MVGRAAGGRLTCRRTASPARSWSSWICTPSPAGPGLVGGLCWRRRGLVGLVGGARRRPRGGLYWWARCSWPRRSGRVPVPAWSAPARPGCARSWAWRFPLLVWSVLEVLHHAGEPDQRIDGVLGLVVAVVAAAQLGAGPGEAADSPPTSVRGPRSPGGDVAPARSAGRSAGSRGAPGRRVVRRARRPPGIPGARRAVLVGWTSRTEGTTWSRIRRLAMISLHTSPLDQPGTGDAGGMNVYVIELSRRLAAAGHRGRHLHPRHELRAAAGRRGRPTASRSATSTPARSRGSPRASCPASSASSPARCCAPRPPSRSATTTPCTPTTGSPARSARWPATAGACRWCTPCTRWPRSRTTPSRSGTPPSPPPGSSARSRSSRPPTC